MRPFVVSTSATDSPATSPNHSPVNASKVTIRSYGSGSSEARRVISSWLRNRRAAQQCVGVVPEC